MNDVEFYNLRVKYCEILSYLIVFFFAFQVKIFHKKI